MTQEARNTGRLLRRVEARNRELVLEAAVDAGMGLVVLAVTSGVVFCVAWYVCISLGGLQFPASRVALCVTAIFVVIGAISAWRSVDPFAGLKPMSDTDHVLFAASTFVDGYVHMNRHTVAGLASVVMGGQANLVSALRSWLHRLPSDPLTIDEAAKILNACRPEVDLKTVACSWNAAILLRRLNLIIPRTGTTLVSLTEKGRDIVGTGRPNRDEIL